MAGEFMVCVDRIIASACLDAGGEVVAGAAAGNQYCAPATVEGQEGFSESRKEMTKCKKSKKGGFVGEVVECRICQEEGDESDMESPCACSGTLKFAHRRCIQRWCSKKGNITCEICNKVYAPNYYAPPPAAGSDVLAIDIRQSWGTARIDLHDSHFLAITAAEQELLHAEYEEYAAAHNSGIACCHVVSLILMILVLSRQILMVASDPMMVQDVSAFVNVSLQFVSFLLPCYVIARLCYLMQSRWRRQARL